MQKSVRNLALVAFLSLATAPVMMANTTGTNPRPKNPPPSGSMVTISAVDTLQIALSAYLGF